jgi:hypothetical protein
MANELFLNVLKNISPDMQLSRFIQAVILMLIVALAASCTTGKEFTAKIFAPRTIIKDSVVTVAPRFLNIDGNDIDSAALVSAEVYSQKDTIVTIAKKEITIPVADAVQKMEPAQQETGVRIVKTGEVRNKRKRE